MNSSPRNELPEPLRSLLDEMANAPVPEELIAQAKHFAGTMPRTNPSRTSALPLGMTALALSLLLAVLLTSPSRMTSVPSNSQTESSNPQPTETIPPPSYWAYRNAANSPEELDALLTQHAAVLLPRSSQEVPRPFSLHDTKEAL